MQFHRIGFLTALAMLPAVAQTPFYHSPMRNLIDHGDGTTTSTNWSGYAVTGTGFTNVSGSWIVPKLTCKSGSQSSVFWVGIDGYSDRTVEQTGTQGDCDGATPRYSAWYEFCCSEPIETIGMAVSPGDKISASVVYNAGVFTATVTNETTGKTFSKSKSVPKAKRTSAEWIAEAPTAFSVLPLADFGTVLFGEDSTGINATCSATDSTTSGPIGNFSTIEEITMAKKSGLTEAVPTSLSSDGTSFSVTWAAK